MVDSVGGSCSWIHLADPVEALEAHPRFVSTLRACLFRGTIGLCGIGSATTCIDWVLKTSSSSAQSSSDLRLT
jgi:hypothetical protein